MYRIIRAEEQILSTAIEVVELQVEELKQNGWIEQGGVSVSSMGINGFYVVSQAMKK